MTRIALKLGIASILLGIGALACSASTEETGSKSDEIAFTPLNVCTAQTDCSAGSFCDLGSGGYMPDVCRPKREVGAYCLDDAACKSNTCTGNVCVATPVCRPTFSRCIADTQCCDGSYCSDDDFSYGYGGYGYGSFGRRCYTKHETGEQCFRNAECKSNRCDLYTCVAADAPAAEAPAAE